MKVQYDKRKGNWSVEPKQEINLVRKIVECFLTEGYCYWDQFLYKKYFHMN